MCLSASFHIFSVKTRFLRILSQENFLAAGVILKAALVAIMKDPFLATDGKFKNKVFYGCKNQLLILMTGYVLQNINQVKDKLS